MSSTTYLFHLIFTSFPSFLNPNIILFILPSLVVLILFFCLKIMFYKAPRMRKVR